MLPQTNATLFSIVAGTSVQSEDWDVAQGTTGSTVKWQGGSDAYVMEKVRTGFAGNEGALQRAKDVTMIIPSNLVMTDNNPLTLEEGDIFTYQFRGVIQSRRVMEYSAPTLPGANVAEYVRVSMTPEPVEDPLSEQ